MEYQQELDFARGLAIGAGQLLMKYFGSISAPKFLSQVKGVVAEVDYLADNHIREAIRKNYPNHGIMSEEADFDRDVEYLWVADALDGTINFVRRKRDFAVTLALTQKGKPVVGVTYLPATQEEFYAVINQGTHFNNLPIRVSEVERLQDAVVNIETNFFKFPENIAVRDQLTPRAGRIHALNSSALELGYVASGRSDACVYFGPSPELAPGALLVQEAGGKVTDVNGRPYTLKSNSIIASNGKIHQELEALLQCL